MKLKHDFMWGMLVHFGTNMWYDVGDSGHEAFTRLWEIPGSDEMRLDKDLWVKYMDYLKESGFNTIVIDVGDGVIYDSHPEIAIKGSWAKADFVAEIKRLNDMGFDVIPKLNFSTCHDAWMKQYSRMVSTPEYYSFCEDIINEVCKMFDYPPYFHVGMDEENYETQKHYGYAVIRKGDLWWQDLYRIINTVEKNGARAIMWADYMRHNPEEFLEKCPKSVIACNWYYFDKFGADRPAEDDMKVRPFELLEQGGFDQIPGASCNYVDENFSLLTDYCKNVVSEKHFLGMLQTTWTMITKPWYEVLTHAADIAVDTIKKY